MANRQSYACSNTVTPELDDKGEPLIVIVGNGPVGVKAAQLLTEKGYGGRLVIFGEELHRPYNRVQLSHFLAGKINQDALTNPISPETGIGVKERVGCKVVSINRASRFVVDETGRKTYYHKLILATGSRAFWPSVENHQVQGVYQFRTLDDSLALLQEKSRSKIFYVVGSGPLGLETAIALKKPGNRVYVEARHSLLSRNLGDQAQQVLGDYVNAAGIEVISRDPLRNVIGDRQVEAVELQSGKKINCDCVIFCAGVVPETVLARNTGLAVNRGVIVDEYMLTSDPDIYAIGECCEYQTQTYGVVAPGFQQAKSCVEHLDGILHQFSPESPQVSVKFGDYSTSYFGQLDVQDAEYFVYANRLKGIYRKLVVKERHLYGAIIIGQWREEAQVRQLVASQGRVRKKWLQRFEKGGQLFEQVAEQSVKALPADYIVCLCQGITRGELSEAIEQGCRTRESLSEKTRAGTVCGSCQPLLMNLLDTPAPNLVMRHQKAMLIASLISLVLIIICVLFKPLQIVDSVQVSWRWEMLWFDNGWKQVSGYTLLALCLFAAALVARKRLKIFRFGHVDTWRYAHALVGIFALLVLLVHTGLRLGENLNFALMVDFLAATTTGSLVGVFMARNHHWSDFKLRQHRMWWSRVHHTLLWMLPALLGFHILSVYYF